MPLVASSRARSVVVAAAVAALAVAGLSGCGPSTQSSPQLSQSASPTPSATREPFRLCLRDAERQSVI